MMDPNAKKVATGQMATKRDKRRGEKQERSLQRRSQIAYAAIEVLALHGVAGLTHRLVAQTAGVSLAATTYYFDTKFDIVAEASKRTLQGYSEAFRRAAARFKAEPENPVRFKQFVVKLLHNAASRDKIQALCWAEIVLDAHRHEESLELTRQWFAELKDVWLEIAESAGVCLPNEVSRSAIDVIIGLLLMTLALDLKPVQVDEVLLHGGNPLEIWTIPQSKKTVTTSPRRTSKKSAATREKIIIAAIEALLTEGAGTIAYRSIATRAGITAAGPFYHFPTIDELLAAAQLRLFEESKERYRAVAAEIGGVVDTERLVDRTATVMVRETTQFSDENLASYAIWLQASRNAELRPIIWSAIVDQYQAWHRLLKPLNPDQRPLDALIAFSGFIGKQIRVLSTGSTLEDLASVRSEFARDITALLRSDFWL